MSKPRILVSDPLPQDILDFLRKEAEVVEIKPAELLAKVGGFEALIVRSGSKVTKEVVAAGTDLKIIGRAGVGVDNIDVDAATARGIMVVNSPQGNTISAAEHTVGLILATARMVPQAHASMHRGEWDRKTFTGLELYNKTLGVLGFGRIGREVATRCASFKMRVLAYDPFVAGDHVKEWGAEPATLDDLLSRCDFVTLHLPKTAETAGLLNAARLGAMKKGAILVNCARGGIIDENALYEVLKSGHLAGAALDVYDQEPPGDIPLLSLPNVVTTPHLAASTHEAQERVAVDVAEQVVEVLRGGPARSAVNIPYVPPEVLGFLRPYLTLAERMGRFLEGLTDGAVRAVRIHYRGELADSETSFVTKAALKGLLSHGSPETVNFVNAALIARERGIELTESKNRHGGTYSNLIEMEIETEKGRRRCSGTIFGDEQPRAVDLDGYRISVVLEGCKLLTWQNDQPGVVGRVGTMLGEHDINIAEMQVGRQTVRDKAVMVMAVDEKPGPEVLTAVGGLTGIEEVRLVTL